MRRTGGSGGGRGRAARGAAWVACALAVCASVCGIGLAGCASDGGELGSAAVYPHWLEQSETVDVQVVRRGTRISFTNTTARSFDAGRLWVNRAYSLGVGEIGVGETVELDLGAFENEFGEGFRAGGFFATETPKALVQVQHRAAGSGSLVGLVVVREDAG